MPKTIFLNQYLNTYFLNELEIVTTIPASSKSVKEKKNGGELLCVLFPGSTPFPFPSGVHLINSKKLQETYNHGSNRQWQLIPGSIPDSVSKAPEIPLFFFFSDFSVKQ